MEIGDRIKSGREELGMSQEELAKKVGYKFSASLMILLSPRRSGGNFVIYYLIGIVTH